MAYRDDKLTAILCGVCNFGHIAPGNYAWAGCSPKMLSGMDRSKLSLRRFADQYEVCLLEFKVFTALHL